MLTITSVEQFSTLLSSTEQPLVLIDLYADWCGPCKRITGPLEDLSKLPEYEKVVFAKLNIDKMEEMEITSIVMPDTIPCILYMKDGKETSRLCSSNMMHIEDGLKTLIKA
jgi:thioredoxin-like negative regulator of GroEL